MRYIIKYMCANEISLNTLTIIVVTLVRVGDLVEWGIWCASHRVIILNTYGLNWAKSAITNLFCSWWMARDRYPRWPTEDGLRSSHLIRGLYWCNAVNATGKYINSLILWKLSEISVYYTFCWNKCHLQDFGLNVNCVREMKCIKFTPIPIWL